MCKKKQTTNIGGHPYFSDSDTWRDQWVILNLPSPFLPFHEYTMYPQNCEADTLTARALCCLICANISWKKKRTLGKLIKHIGYVCSHLGWSVAVWESMAASRCDQFHVKVQVRCVPVILPHPRKTGLFRADESDTKKTKNKKSPWSDPNKNSPVSERSNVNLMPPNTAREEGGGVV